LIAFHCFLDSKKNFKVADRIYVINVDPPLKTPFTHPFKYVIDLKMVSVVVVT